MTQQKNKIGSVAILIGLVALILVLNVLLFSFGNFNNGYSRFDRTQALDSIDDNSIYEFIDYSVSDYAGNSCDVSNGFDSDQDGVADECDNCVSYYNPDQEDKDLDGKGDVCDTSDSNRKKRTSSNKDDNGNNISCFSDLQCNDNNDRTLDRCVNPGTSGSKCEHKSTSCFASSECGVSEFVSANFCKDGQVYRQFRQFNCNNPGTFDAQCSSGVTDVLIEICSLGCGNGVCLSSNPSPSACRADNECGSSGFVGENFCKSDGNVYKKFRQFRCNNPGTSNAQCNSGETDVVMEFCSYGCNQGVCKQAPVNACDDDIDNDGDGFIDYPADPQCSSRSDVSEN